MTPITTLMEVRDGHTHHQPHPDRHVDRRCAHSSVEFAVKHMGIANVRGKFTEFEGTLEVGEDLASSSARGTVKVASITTGEEQRDAHLRSEDFFNVDEFPEIHFESTLIEAIDEDSSNVVGKLTMHGVTQEVKLKAVVQGTDVDPWGNERAGLGVVGVLKRSDFDMKFNQALGSGNVLVGDKVNMSLDISAVSRSNGPRTERGVTVGGLPRRGVWTDYPTTARTPSLAARTVAEAARAAHAPAIRHPRRLAARSAGDRGRNP